MNGNVLQLTRYEYDIYGNCSHTKQYSQAGEAITYTEYNPNKQLIKIVDPDGNITRFSYHYRHWNKYVQTVLQATKTDPLGNQTITTMNVLGKVGSLVKKNSFGKITAKNEFFYDGIGNCQYRVETVITPEQADRIIVTHWLYNSSGNLLSLTEAEGTPEQRITRCRYNSAGQKEVLVKPDGIEIFYTYNAKGMLASIKSSDNSIFYRYEYNKNDLATKITDQLQNSTTAREYDSANRLVSEILANGLNVKYTHDKLGRLTQMDLPDGSGVAYVYNALNLTEVRRLRSSGEQIYSHIYQDYDLSGCLLSSKLIENAGKVNYSYDLQLRPRGISHPNWSQTVAANGYDPVSNLTQMTIQDGLGSTTCNFTYDDLYQLTSEEGIAAHSYGTDSIYNRVNKDQQPYEINSLNQLLQETDAQYAYDNSGNLTQEIKDGAITQYAYDALDRLTSITQENTKYVYSYDADSRRITKSKFIRQNDLEPWSKDSEQLYLYQGQNEIGTVVNGSLIELRVLGLGRGAEIGAAVALEIQGNLLAPLHDISGNVICLIDSATGECVEFYRYTAFGEEQLFNAAQGTLSESAYSNQWRYSSKRKDVETGLIYFGQRFYNAGIGSWISCDPLGYADGPNLYAYLHNNPLTSIDFHGLFDDSAWETPLPDFNANYSSVVDTCGSVLTACSATGNGLYKGTTKWVTDPLGTYEKFRTQPFINPDSATWEDSVAYTAERVGECILPEIVLGGAVAYGACCSSVAIVTTVEAGLVPSASWIFARTSSLLYGKPNTVSAPIPKVVENYETRGVVPCWDRISRTGQIMDRGGLTIAGRALDKHGARPGSVFPKAFGNPTCRNMQGQFHLDDILTHPQTISYPNRFGGRDFFAPDGRGIRFDAEYNFTGFLQPRGVK